MKLVIASDIHGSATWTEVLMERIEQERPCRVLLLGDILYHGPRNDLPDGYSPKKVASFLNSIAGSVIAVRGNCDAEVDQMMLDFPCTAGQIVIPDGTYTLFATHGHLPNMTPEEMCPLPPMSAYLFGHTHIKMLEKVPNTRALPHLHQALRAQACEPAPAEMPANNEESSGFVLKANPGSISLPKDGLRSYAVYENGTFALKDLEENTVLERLSL